MKDANGNERSPTCHSCLRSESQGWASTYALSDSSRPLRIYSWEHCVCEFGRAVAAERRQAELLGTPATDDGEDYDNE